jgi:hypothetical protein
LAIALPASATVAVTAPINNSTVGTSVPVIATSSTACAGGVAASGIYVDNTMQYVVNGNVVNTTISLSTGKHYVVVQEWDYCGGSTTAPLNLTAVLTASVNVTSPVANSSVGTSVPFVATATSSCAQGVAAMGVYVNNQLIYQANGTTLNAPITLPVGNQTAVVQEWDFCGGSTTTPVSFTVTGTTISSIQAAPGWNQWGQFAPTYSDCTSNCAGVTFSMNQHQSNVSLSGNATQYNLGGNVPYSDVLFSNPVIGQGNQQGLTDANHTLLPTLHNFVLNEDVFLTNLAVTQDLEFDINWYGNGFGMEFGTECNNLGGGVWDIWDNVNATWVHTPVPCVLNNNAWNHVTLQVQRLANNSLLYQSVTVNGVVNPLNITVPPFSVPAGWWGMTINFQMDGDYAQHSNTAYVDNMNFTYW